MRPYNKDFMFQVIKKYNNLIKQGTCGDYRIVKDTIKIESLQGYMYEKKEEYDIDVVQLYKNDVCLMELTTKEIESSYEIISSARGKVGIIGLGLGYATHEIALKPNVKEVIVYESSDEIIKLYNENFEENDKIKIIQGDATNAQRENFDFFYVDRYERELTSTVVKDYKIFIELHEVEDYAFWGMEHFLLSCKYEDIVWVYIPENWISMSKKSYEALDASGYIDWYKPLDEEKVRKILLEFKEILNSDM